MYTRSYYDNDGVAHPLSIGYDGTALCDEPPMQKTATVHADTAQQRAQTKLSPKDSECERPECEGCPDCKGRSDAGGIFGQIRAALSSFLPSGLLPQKFGLEELLILGLAIYLFFSNSHDREFALMLLALIFIGS